MCASRLSDMRAIVGARGRVSPGRFKSLMPHRDGGGSCSHVDDSDSDAAIAWWVKDARLPSPRREGWKSDVIDWSVAILAVDDLAHLDNRVRRSVYGEVLANKVCVRLPRIRQSTSHKFVAGAVVDEVEDRDGSVLVAPACPSFQGGFWRWDGFVTGALNLSPNVPCGLGRVAARSHGQQASHPRSGAHTDSMASTIM